MEKIVNEFQNDTLSDKVFTVELRFWGPREDMETLATKLGDGLQIEVIQLGPYGKTDRTQMFACCIDGTGCRGFQPEWKTLEDGLEFLRQHLTPAKQAIIELTKSHSGGWWCGQFHSGLEGGVTVSATLMEALAGFNLPIYLNTFLSEKH